jgi:4-amino-4-deoxy-L-arabinose transferase-like glycosyltransferase
VMPVTTEGQPRLMVSRLRTSPTVPVVVVAAAAGALATLLRLVGLGRAGDIFVDEPLYTGLGHSVRSGGFPMVNGDRFFLHPPGFFYLEAGWEHLFGSRTDLVASIYEMRALNAGFAGGTALLLVLLVARVGSLEAAAATGALFALDPFCIRQNERVLLETTTMFWVLAGYVVLLPLAEASPSAGPRLRRARMRYVRAFARDAHRRRAVGAGLLFGLATLTKDEAALVTVVPLLAAAARRSRSRQRSLLLLTAGAAAVPYAIYLTTVAATGHLGEFWAAKSSGALRLLGFLQISGFNEPGAPSLGARLVAQLRYFGTTYALLAASPVALVFLIRRGNPTQRLLGLFFGSTALYLGYAVLFGTLEEQELYLMFVPALAVLGVAATLLRDRYGYRNALGVVTVSLLAVVIALDDTTYLQWRLHPDDGYAQLRTYMAAHVPAEAKVAVADGSAEELGASALILRDRYRVRRWVSPSAQARENVQYLVVPWRVVDEGYSYLSKRAVHRATEHAYPLFTFRGRTHGRLVLYWLPRSHRPRVALRTRGAPTRCLRCSQPHGRGAP